MMDFPGIGTISYAPPSEHLRDFFKRKYVASVSGMEFNKNGVIYANDVIDEVTQATRDLPADQREAATEEMMHVWEFCLMCTKPGESTTVEQVADSWVERAFSPPEQRKQYMDQDKEIGKLWFEHMDLNKDGKIDYSEWKKGCSVFGEEAVKMVFETIDVNADGVISLDEWLYAMVCYDFTSGPENPVSQMFGSVSTEGY